MSLPEQPPSAEQTWSAERLRPKPLFKALDAILTAPLKPRLGAGAHLLAILNPRSSHYERVASVVNLTDCIIRDTARRLSALLCEDGRLPFTHRRFGLMAFGSGATVFLVRRHDGDKVLKIYRRSLGKDPASLLEIAKWVRWKYETVSSWYSGGPGFIPNAEFLLLHGPVLGRPAVGMLQPYIPGAKKDFFGDFTNDDWVSLLKADPILREQVRCFAGGTLRVYDEQQQCVDFFGKGNLILAGNAGRQRLLLLDYGIFDLARLRQAPADFSRIEECMRRLKFLRETFRKQDQSAMRQSRPTEF